MVRYQLVRSVHLEQSSEVLSRRAAVLDLAFQAHPERYKSRKPVLKSPPNEVWINGWSACAMIRRMRLAPRIWTLCLLLPLLAWSLAPEIRPRIRDLGIEPGIFPPGPVNAITDVEGVRVGHRTLIRGESVRTGVTAILPHGGNLFQSKTPAAVYVGNGFGKAAGFLQIQELGTSKRRFDFSKPPCKLSPQPAPLAGPEDRVCGPSSPGWTMPMPGEWIQFKVKGI